MPGAADNSRQPPRRRQFKQHHQNKKQKKGFKKLEKLFGSIVPIFIQKISEQEHEIHSDLHFEEEFERICTREIFSMIRIFQDKLPYLNIYFTGIFFSTF